MAAKRKLARPDLGLESSRLRSQIESRLLEAGADQLGVAVEQARVSFSFRLDNVVFRLTARMPDRDDPQLIRTPSGRTRTKAQLESALKAARVRTWKALAAWVGSCVEAADSGVMDLAQAFSWCVVLPDGRTTGEWLEEELGQAAASGRMPASIPALPAQTDRTPGLMEVIQELFPGDEPA